MCCIIQSISVSSKHLINDCSDLTNIRLRKFSISACCSTVILNYGTCFTLSDPGYFKHLTIRGGGGGFKSRRPPLRSRKSFVNLHHIIHVHFTRCFRHVPIGFFFKFAIFTILQRFQNKK